MRGSCSGFRLSFAPLAPNRCCIVSAVLTSSGVRSNSGVLFYVASVAGLPLCLWRCFWYLFSVAVCLAPLSLRRFKAFGFLLGSAFRVVQAHLGSFRWAAQSLAVRAKGFCNSKQCNCNAPTATQQGAAPDRLQLRSLRSFLASVSALPAAGELSR